PGKTMPDPIGEQGVASPHRGHPGNSQPQHEQQFSGRVEISSNLFAQPIPVRVEIIQKALPPQAEQQPGQETPAPKETASPSETTAEEREDTGSEGEEEPTAEKPQEQQEGASSHGHVRPADLFGYLESLAAYLPFEKKREFIESDMPLKLAAIRNKLSGKEGLRSLIEHRFSEKEEQRVETQATTPPQVVTHGRVQQTLSYLEEMSDYIPEEDVRLALKAKIAHILNNL
ncbi:MAG TPA: hypothetical protein PLG43_07720, partial [Spirochaetia bacterium]|nr:hypothetical protein [Spirochaetia bacterium]